MFAVVLKNADPPAGGRLVAQYAMRSGDCTISLVELRAPLLLGGGDGQSLPAGSLEEGLELARRIVAATSSGRARSES